MFRIEKMERGKMTAIHLSEKLKKELNKIRPVVPFRRHGRFTFAWIVWFLVQYYKRREREDASNRRTS